MSETREKIYHSYVEFYEGFNQKALVSSDQIFADKSSGLWRPETNTFMDFMTLKSLFYSEDWVFILVDRIASKLSSQYLRVMRDEIVGGKKIAKPAEGHPVQKILDQPNEIQDYHTWMYSLVADDCVLGNSFQWFSKSLGQIIPIPGENIAPMFDGRGNLIKYQVTQGSEEQGIKPVSWSLSTDEIMHVRRPNPSSMWIGLSPFIPAQKSLLFSRYSAEYLNNFYIKGAQPGLVLEMSQEANQEMALRLLRSMENAYTGRRNQMRSMVLPRGVKATQFNASIADQQLIDLVNQNREKIINILQVPKHELSIAEAGSLGSEEYKIALKNFWRGPLRSTMRRIAGTLTVKLKDALGDGFYIDFDLSDIEYLSEDEGIKADTAAKMLATHTLNEVRAKVYDMPPLEGGDKVPGVAPVFPQTFSTQPKEIIDVSAQDTQYVTDVDKAPEVVSALAVDTKRIERAAMFLKANGGKWWEDRRAEEDKEQERAQDDMAILALALLGDIGDIAAKVITGKTKDAASDKELRKRLLTALDQLEDDYLAGYAQTLSATVDMGYNTSLKLPFDLPNQDAIEALRDRNEQRRLSLLKARGLDSFKSVVDNSTESVVKLVAGGLENGKSLQEIAEEIKQRYSKEGSAGRALTIARTEALTAQSVGQAAAMKDLERATGEKVLKMWLNAGDDRVRDLHEIEGEIRKMNEKFSNGLLYPREPGGDAENVINCFTPETLVIGVDAEKLFSRLYDGPMVTINFKGGDKLSGTPNHPVLTPKGWVALGSLAKGGKVFKASGFNCSSVVDGNIKKIKATFAELLGSLSDSFATVGVSGTIMDFHGDGSAENVDVIDIERALQNRAKTSGFKEGENFGLTDSDLAHGFGFGGSGNSEPIGGVGSTHSGISASDLLASSVHVESAPLQDFGLASPSLSEASIVESLYDGGSGNIFDLANLQDGELINEVHLDEIISVDVVSYHGYVYNLQTKGGYYIANNTIVHNCRCSWVMVPESEAGRLDNWKDELET